MNLSATKSTACVLERTFFVRSGDDVCQFEVSLTVEAYQEDFVCRVVYGTSETRKEVPTYGIDVWQALLLGLKFLFREMKWLEGRKHSKFFHDHATAQANEGGWNVEEVFSNISPLDL